MKKYLLLLALAALTTISLNSCGGDSKDEGDEASTEETTDNASSGIPDIDVASLTDEASILDAMQKVVDARNADVNDDHYVELTKLYTDVKNAATAYMGTLEPEPALAFNDKLRAIEDQMK